MNLSTYSSSEKVGAENDLQAFRMIWDSQVSESNWLHIHGDKRKFSHTSLTFSSVFSFSCFVFSGLGQVFCICFRGPSV